MPQKKNPDFAEVIKSKAALSHGFLSSLLGIQKGGLSGYNRDTQATKYLLMDLVRECEVAPIILEGVFKSLTINTEKMRELCETNFMNSVDIADHLARTLNLSFRECYHLLARAVKLSPPETKITTASLKKALAESDHPAEIGEDLAELFDPQKILKLRQHQGSPSPEQTSLQIEELSAELNSLFAPLVDLQNNIIAAQENCQNYGV